MLKAGLKIICFLISITFLISPQAFPQTRQEKEEKTLEVKRLKESYRPSKIYSTAGVFFGYDSNVNLSSTRKGDLFEEFLFSLSFSKPLPRNWGFYFDYDLDVLNYNQYTENSNILNHLRFTLYKRFFPFKVGAGYNLHIFNYPHNRHEDFIFHRGFVYLALLSRNIYQRLEFQAGIKDYTDEKALGDTITTFQDKERLDRRTSIEYLLKARLSPKLILRLGLRFSKNNSNCRYVDFYDYHAWRHLLGLDWRAQRNLVLFSSIIHIKKDYNSRTVTLRPYTQKDNLYAGNVGLRYRLNAKNTFSLYYTYRENSSNDPLQEYSESIIGCGWQYKF